MFRVAKIWDSRMRISWVSSGDLSLIKLIAIAVASRVSSSDFFSLIFKNIYENGFYFAIFCVGKDWWMGVSGG